MKVLLFAPMVRFAMKHYLQCVVNQGEAANISMAMVVPKHAEISTQSKVFKIGGGGKLGVIFANINPLTYLKLAFALYVVRPDCVHILNGEARPTTIWLVALARLARIRTIMSVHDPNPHPGARFDVAMHRLGGITKRITSDIHIHEKVHVPSVEPYRRTLHIFPHPDIATLFPAEPRVSREPMVLFFGRIEPYKGLDNFVEAAIRLGPIAEFVIAGVGTITPEVASRIASSPALFTVLNRFISDEEMINLFDRATVVMLPYHSATQSGIPAGAASRGAVPVGFAVGGLTNQIREVGGIAVPAADVNALVEATKTVLAGDFNFSPDAVRKHLAAFKSGLLEMYTAGRPACTRYQSN
jgi:glycosyltransferase involved in cell wall biosynthesis